MASPSNHKGLLHNQLYSLRDALSNSAYRGTTDREAYRQIRVAKRGEITVTHPLIIYQDSGSEPQDFIWVSLEPLIHDRVADLLTLSKISGWNTYPVEVYDRAGHVVPGYHGLSITGRCQSMFLDREHSEVVYERKPRAWVPYYKGLFITMESWDHSDLFTSADKQTDYIIMTQRVFELFRKAQVTNIRMEPISEVRVYAMDQPNEPRTT
jgi:hypothetical protein